MANSPKYHKITEDIRPVIRTWNVADVDKAIRSDLETVREKLLNSIHWVGLRGDVEKELNSILGLGDVEAFKVGPLPVCQGCNQKMCNCQRSASKETLPYPKEAPKQEWCEDVSWEKAEYIANGHIHGMSGKDFKYCPICGAKRLIIKSREERLAEAMHANWSRKYSLPDWEHCINKDAWIDEASFAIKWCKENQ